MCAVISGNSQAVTTNQTGVHKNLLDIVTKHASTPFCRPIASHTIDAFEALASTIGPSNDAIILDSGCGTADSSVAIAREHPLQVVVGVDKSAARLNKFRGQAPSNLHLVRAELIDMWRLFQQEQLPIAHHYIFYPNPWPKGKHLKRRWHGHPIFPAMMGLSSRLTLRTNWRIYALEFLTAIKRLLDLGVISGEVDCMKVETSAPISAFEKKYLASGHELLEVNFRRSH